MIELLAPAGTFDKLEIAFLYGADAVYFSGKRFGLRAYAGNFSDEEILKASKLAHKLGKKVYVTINILARESDFNQLKEYLMFLEKAKVDGVIASDIGIIAFIKEHSSLDVHVSTQANVLNSYSVKFFEKLGVKRIILARELSFEEILEIKSKTKIELEVFVHGAMCISYSGRCLLSNYLANRDSNRGQCVQACRWEYSVTEKSREGQLFEITQDERGTYIFNSKDLNLIAHLNKLIEAGIKSFKIEGRMKSQYYVANVVNAYRRAIDNFQNFRKKIVKEEGICGIENWIVPKELENELLKSSHRDYTTGFTFPDKKGRENLITSRAEQSYAYVAMVLEDSKNGKTFVEQKNRFKVGDELEILSFGKNFNKKFVVKKMFNVNNEQIEDAKLVEQKLFLECEIPLKKGEILRQKTNNKI